MTKSTSEPLTIVAPVSQPSNQNTDTIPKKNSPANNFSLDNFKNVPKELDGCSCYFSETKESFDRKEYLFAADFDSIAVISINKRLIKLRLVSSTKKAGTFSDSDHIEVYSNNNYKVTVDIKYKHTIASEVWWNDGTILIESTDGQKLVKKFVGECGC